MAIPAVQRMSIEEFLALPEDFLRHELFDGEHVVTPSPRRRHQKAVHIFTSALDPFVDIHGGVELYWSPADVHLGARTVLQPDLFIIDLATDALQSIRGEYPVPIMIVEILSPSTSALDRGARREAYLEAGVGEYWIVDAEDELVEVWRQGMVEAEIVRERLVFSLSGGFGGEIDLGRVWEQLR